MIILIYRSDFTLVVVSMIILIYRSDFTFGGGVNDYINI